MKAISYISLAIFILSLSACSEDDSCGLNGMVNGECFQVVKADYNIQTFSSNGNPFTRENLFLAIQFDNGAERYGIRARSNQYNDDVFVQESVDYRFATGLSYNESSMTFNGDINNPATGKLTVTFSKVDRENGLVSGSFVWKGESTGETTTNLSGTFTNVEVELEQ